MSSDVSRLQLAGVSGLGFGVLGSGFGGHQDWILILAPLLFPNSITVTTLVSIG